MRDGVPGRITVEGRLTGAEVGELETLRSEHADGLAALSHLLGEGVLLRQAPLHLAWPIDHGS